MKCLEIRLHPRSLFPLTIPSDTIFGAICSAASDLGYDIDSLLLRFASSSPPFILSSAFPFVKPDVYRYFFPLPIVPPYPFTITEESLEGQKMVKETRFVYSEIFLDLMKGNLTENDLIEKHDSYELHNGMLFPNSAKLSITIEDRDQPHNLINRVSGQTDKFFFNSGFSFRNAGLFFFMSIADEGCEEMIFSALRLLQDRGIGGRVSQGMGQFTFNYERRRPDSPYFKSPDSPCFISLSRYIPTQDEFSEFGENKWYDPVPVRGKSGDGIMKKSVIMLREGSIFKNLHRCTYGSVVTVRDSPQAVTCGYAFPVSYGRTS